MVLVFTLERVLILRLHMMEIIHISLKEEALEMYTSLVVTKLLLLMHRVQDRTLPIMLPKQKPDLLQMVQ